ncbi:MAG: hypothetical protein ABFR97_08080 [Thermodesulfobacteriota bacterium]
MGRGKIRSGRFCLTALLLPFLLPLLLTTPAWAVQTHGGAEGLVSHQIGHLLLFSAMVILLIRQRRFKMRGAGWHYFRVFLWLIILWNILTFTGHWLREGVEMDRFVRSNTHITAFRVEGLYDLIFYLTRLEHLLLVPAFFCLLIAVKRWDTAS